MQPFIGYVIPLGGGPGGPGGPPVDPGYGVPPMPGGGPVDPGWGTRPPVDPGWGGGAGSGPRPSQPIVLPDPPTAGNLPTVPPDAVYPPLPPLEPPAGGGGSTGKFILVWIPGVGYRWLHLGPDVSPTPPKPPTGTPKT